MVTATDDQWIYVQSKNGVLRRVNISSAQVTYDAGVPRERRQDPAARALKPGVEIRVTAEQDSNGEWRASHVEITGASAAAPTGTPPDDPGGGQPAEDRHEQKDAPMTLAPGCWAA